MVYLWRFDIKTYKQFPTAKSKDGHQMARLAGFVAQIPFRDSSHESSMIAGVYEQLGPYEVQDHELVDLQ